YLNGFDTNAELPVKNKKALSTGNRGNGHYQVTLVTSPGHRWEQFTQHLKITLACLLYGTWGILVQRYNNREDIVFGTTVSGRSHTVKGIEDIVGLFINTIPLRIKTTIDSPVNVPGFFRRLNARLQERDRYENTSLADIKEYGEIDFQDGLFDTILVIENYPLQEVLPGKNGALSVDSYSMFEKTHYDLTVGITPGDDIRIDFDFNPILFTQDSIRNLARHFMNLLEDILQHPDKEITALNLMSEEEKNGIVFDFNRTETQYPLDKTIHGLFEDRVDKTPSYTAINLENHRLTYSELNRRSNRIAHLLVSKGVKPGHIVGIMMERSLEMVIGIMGILKAGGAYLPIAPDYPRERIDFMLRDSNACVLLKSEIVKREIQKSRSVKQDPNDQYSNVPNKNQCSQCVVLNFEPLNFESCFTLRNFEFRASDLSPSGLAYILYTSGTTGKPKGVMVNHSSVINRSYLIRERYPLTEKDIILQAASFIFDVSVDELFRWILPGGSCCLLPVRAEKEPERIITTMLRHQITIADFVPSMLSVLLDYIEKQDIPDRFTGLRWVVTGADTVGLNLVKRFNATLFKFNKTRLINAYGPTESTVDVTWFDCSHIDMNQTHEVPIGKPIENTRIYILDLWGNIQPIGIPGELCTSGAGLARGYLNRPELTGEKFEVRSSHFALNSILYHTGDLARWLTDGNIEFLGRMDHQVKIRGFRVELGEIQTLLLSHEHVKDAVVIASGTGEESYICAYYIPVEGDYVPLQGDVVPGLTFSLPRLKEHLSSHLPGYMMPSYFVTLDTIPLTASGKVDRKALPAPGVVDNGDYTPPRNGIEEELVEIWAETLGLEKEKTGIDANFFRFGGHSLKAITLASKIHKNLEVKIPMEVIFNHPTPRELSHYIKGAQTHEYFDIAPIEKQEYYPLSSAQKRLYFLRQMAPDSTVYNMPAVTPLHGAPTIETIRSVFLRLINRHESLRTSFEIIAGEPVQKVHDHVEFEIEFLGRGVPPWSPLNGNHSGVHNVPMNGNNPGSHGGLPLQSLREFIRPFDLSRAPLLRLRLIETGPGTSGANTLLMDMHHIISDGLSHEILSRDFTALYNDKLLPPLKLQYRDFAVWHNSPGREKIINEQETYWLKEFSGTIPVLDMNTDFPRPPEFSFEGRVHFFRIHPGITPKVRELASEFGVTLLMFLIAVYKVMLSIYTGQRELVVGTVVAGRPHQDLRNIIGFFVNMLALKTGPGSYKTFRQFLARVRQKAIQAYDNQDYPFEELVNKLQIPREPGRHPLVDTVFAMMDTAAGTGETESPEPAESPSTFYRNSHFDLSFFAADAGDSIDICIEYSTSLFRHSTIEHLAGYYTEILEQVVKNPGICLDNIKVSHDLMALRANVIRDDPEDWTF
ncbi:MAG: amino acid adenylation domain-containing protein, partial [bacterium]|nr:amino acid adenylation domain-containing protein [bacterium]